MFLLLTYLWTILWTCFTSFWSISIADFEQVNANWAAVSCFIHNCFSQNYLNICQFPATNLSATKYPSANLKTTENLKLENPKKVEEEVKVELLKLKAVWLRKHHKTKSDKTKRNKKILGRNDVFFWNNVQKATSEVKMQ